MTPPQVPPACQLEDVLITEQLRERPAPPPDLEAENAALRSIASELVKDPGATHDALVLAALELCGAGSTGVSLLETLGDGTQVFRWVALAGDYALHLGGSTPADFSPCGTTLSRGAPQLFSYPERFFTYFQQSRPVITEGLVVPLRTCDQAGTLWVVSHDPSARFTAEDVRVMSSLADFASAAIVVQTARMRLEQHSKRSTEPIDPASIAQLYDRYAGTVMALVLRIVKDPKDAEAVTLQVFEETWRRGKMDAHESRVAADLMTRARKRAVGLLRSRSIGRTPRYDDAEWLTPSSGVGGRPTDSSSHRAVAPLIRQALADLCLEDRRAVVLSVLDGFTAEEIGKAVGESTDAINRRICAGLTQISRRRHG